MIKLCDNFKDILFILDNLREEDAEELKALWGKNWRNISFSNIKKSQVNILYGKNEINSIVPIAMGGFQIINLSPSVACVWLISSKYINLNKKLLMKNLKEQINQASKKYNIMYNYIYKSNLSAKKWLKELGFSFDNPHPKNLFVPDDFEFFYKLSG